MKDNQIILDGKYHWSGNLGCWFKTYHKRKEMPELGDVKVIRGILFYCYERWTESDIGEPVAWWVPVDKSLNNYEAIQEFIKKEITK